jgi:hypothetical protein
MAAGRYISDVVAARYGRRSSTSLVPRVDARMSDVLLLAVEINAPRFDTPWRAILNVVGVALWLAAVVSIIVDRRRGRHVSVWGWIAIGATVAIDGVYVPLGPVSWLAARAVDHERGTPTSTTADG